MSEIAIIKPGILVAMSTNLRGNTSYSVNRRGELVDEMGRLISEWDTQKVVSDPDELERAIKLRTKIRGLILSVCVTTAFSNTLMCPLSRKAELQEAIAEGHRLARDFNVTANVTNMHFSVYTGEIAADDLETVRNITVEVRRLMDDMQTGLVQFDVKAIRDACNKAVAMGAMLSEEASERVQVAIDVARESAKRIVKAGEVAAQEIDRRAIDRIDMARTSFLDIDMGAFEVATPAAGARAVDMEV